MKVTWPIVYGHLFSFVTTVDVAIQLVHQLVYTEPSPQQHTWEWKKTGFYIVLKQHSKPFLKWMQWLGSFVKLKVIHLIVKNHEIPVLDYSWDFTNSHKTLYFHHKIILACLSVLSIHQIFRMQSRRRSQMWPLLPSARHVERYSTLPLTLVHHLVDLVECSHQFVHFHFCFIFHLNWGKKVFK